MPTHPKLLAALLEGQPLAVRARGRPRGDAVLLERVQHLVPQSLRLHCLGASLAGRALQLVVSSPVWATRARYCESDLVAGLQVLGVERVVVSVRPGGQGGQRAPRPRAAVSRRLSQRTVAHLLAMAGVIEDPGLGGALRRLARRHATGGGDSDHGPDPQAGLNTGP